MASDDHLSNEISVSAQLTPDGVEARAKSRALSSFDRLLGNLVELANAPIERRNAKTRAISEGEVKLIQAIAERGIARLGYDPEFAERAVAANFQKIARGQENREAVVQIASDDLSLQPPTNEENNTGSNELNAEFMDRFEDYAERASTEDLRQRWGKVLASEIRKPGTFSRKVMRVTDELDFETAQLFERVCRSRIRGGLVKSLLEEKLDFSDMAALVSAGLIVAGNDQVAILEPNEFPDGTKIWTFKSRGRMFAFKQTAQVTFDQKTLQHDENIPVVPVHVLTDVGKALSSILDDHEDEAFFRLFALVKELVGDQEIFAYEARGEAWVATPKNGSEQAQG